MKFLGVSPDDCASGTPKFRVIPFGLEKTVSFGGGTSKGPLAIIEASQEVETFDIEYSDEIYQSYGIETADAVQISSEHNKALEQLKGLVSDALDDGKTPVILGGEHSISYGSILPFLERYPNGLTIVQFDAHCDLRDAYLGDKLSHASVMRRCLDHDNAELISIGIRNISAEEYAFIKNNHRVHIFTSQQVKEPSAPQTIARLVAGKDVFITFDVDGLDPSIMPSTGTPEPDGLGWGDALNHLRSIAHVANIVGFDMVELAPIKDLHAPDFISAKLLYKMMSYTHTPPPMPVTE